AARALGGGPRDDAAAARRDRARRRRDARRRRRAGRVRARGGHARRGRAGARSGDGRSPAADRDRARHQAAAARGVPRRRRGRARRQEPLGARRGRPVGEVGQLPAERAGGGDGAPAGRVRSDPVRRSGAHHRGLVVEFFRGARAARGHAGAVGRAARGHHAAHGDRSVARRRHGGGRGAAVADRSALGRRGVHHLVGARRAAGGARRRRGDRRRAAGRDHAARARPLRSRAAPGVMRWAGYLVGGTLGLVALHVGFLLLYDPADAAADRAEPARLTRAPSVAGAATLVFAGDTAETDASLPTLEARGFEYPFSLTVDLLRDADLAVVNAEAPITDGGDRFPVYKDYVYRAPARSADALAWAGVDVLALSNNHSIDYGASGLRQTIEAAQRRGMATIGAGADAVEARRGLIATIGGVRVGLLAFCENQFLWRVYVDQFARRGHAGVA